MELSTMTTYMVVGVEVDLASTTEVGIAPIMEDTKGITRVEVTEEGTLIMADMGVTEDIIPMLVSFRVSMQVHRAAMVGTVVNQVMAWGMVLITSEVAVAMVRVQGLWTHTVWPSKGVVVVDMVDFLRMMTKAWVAEVERVSRRVDLAGDLVARAECSNFNRALVVLRDVGLPKDREVVHKVASKHLGCKVVCLMFLMRLLVDLVGLVRIGVALAGRVVKGSTAGCIFTVIEFR